MDKAAIVGRLIRPVTFLAVYAASLAFYLHDSPRTEVTGDFAWEHNYKPRVLGVGRATSNAAPQYVSYLWTELPSPAAASASVTFLLPAQSVVLRGGHTHRVTVLESGPGRQLVQYEYGRAHELEARHLMTTRYVAYDARVELVSARRTQHASALMIFLLLAIPAYIAAGVAHPAWMFIAARRHRPPPAPPGG